MTSTFLHVNCDFSLSSLSSLSQRVVGEVHQVDQEKLQFLDEFEGYPTFYSREKVTINMDNGDDVQAWTYFLADFRPYLLQLETFADYDTNGPHNLPYMTQ